VHAAPFLFADRSFCGKMQHMDFTHFIERLVPRTLDWGITLLTAILILVAGWIAAGWISKVVSKMLMRSEKIDPTVRTFTASFVRYSILIVTIMAMLARVGVQTASLVALLGAAGLAIGLALQGTLSDVAAGVILLAVRPFRVGDAVQLATHEGIVKSVALFTTEIATPDNRKIVIPNSKVWGQPIINFSGYAKRRIDMTLDLERPEEAESAIALLNTLIRENKSVLPLPEASVLINSLSDGTRIEVQAWVEGSTFSPVKAILLAEINTALAAAKISRVRRNAAAQTVQA
jgi:small conductance mechanosensitive channel